MAMKPAPGEVVTQTTTTRVSPEVEIRKLSDGTPIPRHEGFWQWFDTVSLEFLNRYEAEARVYRKDGRGKKSLCESFSYPPDTVKPTQPWVQDNYGGGPYVISMKLENQWRFEVDFDCAGLPFTDEEISARQKQGRNGSQMILGHGHANGGSDVGMLLNFFRESQRELIAELRNSRGGDTAAEALRNSMNLGTQVLAASVPAVTRIVENAAHAGASPTPDPFREIQMQFFQAMISKMMNPADPIETFSKMLTAVKTLIPETSGGGAGESIGQTLIRVLPQAMSHIGSIMQNNVRMREIELSAVRGMPVRTLPAALPAAVPQAPPAAAPFFAPAGAPSQAAPAAPPAPEPAASARSIGVMEFVQVGLVRIVNNPRNTAAECAHECLVLVDAYMSDIVDHILALENPEDGLLEFFRTEPILQQVPQDPRLAEVVKLFIQQARESRAVLAPPAPPPAQPESAPQPVA